MRIDWDKIKAEFVMLSNIYAAFYLLLLLFAFVLYLCGHNIIKTWGSFIITTILFLVSVVVFILWDKTDYKKEASKILKNIKAITLVDLWNRLVLASIYYIFTFLGMLIIAAILYYFNKVIFNSSEMVIIFFALFVIAILVVWRSKVFAPVERRKIKEFVDFAPDSPQAFGYKMIWLAVRGMDKNLLAQHLAKKGSVIHPTNWAKGLEGVYYRYHYTFITPPLDNWSFVVNFPSYDLEKKETIDFLKFLSRSCDEVLFFGTHRVTAYTSWAKFVGGNYLRGFAYADGEIFTNHGKMTAIELEILEKEKKEIDLEDMAYYVAVGYDSLLAGQENVMMVAGAWSINPQTLVNYQSKELGIILKCKTF